MSLKKAVRHKLIPFIKEHQSLYYFTKCFKERHNEEFIQQVLETDPDRLTFTHRGDELADEIIYDIAIGRPSYGFFAEYRDMLDFIFFAKDHGLKPHVRFTTDFNYGGECFYKFFKSVSGHTDDEIEKAKNVVVAIDKHRYAMNRFSDEGSAYGLTEDYILEMARVTAEYISLSDAAEAFVSNSIKEIGIDENTLGVHVRGTDYKVGYMDHPVFVTFEEYLNKAVELIEKAGYTKVFLATDDADALSLFSDRLGDKLITYSDVSRASGSVSVEFSDENTSRVDLGMQVLRDMMSLSKCGGIVMGRSNVGICALITNKANALKGDMPYKTVDILDKGINKTGEDFTVGK